MGLFDKFGGKKKEAFYEEYAASHNLERSRTPVPRATKNLEGEIQTKVRFDGRLSTSFKGSVALVETTVRASFEMRTTDRDAAINTWLPEGTETTGTETNVNVYPATVVLVPLEKLPGVVDGLAVKKNHGKQTMGKNDAYGDLKRVSIEGLDLDQKFFVYAAEGADPERVRSLFTPSFSAWLNQRDGKFFSFEFGQGTLVTKHGGKFPKEAGPLDDYVSEACELATQLEAAAG